MEQIQFFAPEPYPKIEVAKPDVAFAKKLLLPCSKEFLADVSKSYSPNSLKLRAMSSPSILISTEGDLSLNSSSRTSAASSTVRPPTGTPQTDMPL